MATLKMSITATGETVLTVHDEFDAASNEQQIEILNSLLNWVDDHIKFRNKLKNNNFYNRAYDEGYDMGMKN